jgi:hypothetical protein
LPEQQAVAQADHDQWNYVTPNGGSRVRCLWSSAVLRDDIPAVLEVARFPADGKNRTALQSAQGPPGCRFPLVRRQRMRSGAGKPVTGL